MATGIAPKTAYPTPDMWNVFGHSYTQFTGGSVDQTGRFDALLRASLDVEYTNWLNRSVSGAQLVVQGRKLGGFGRVLQEAGKNTSRAAPYAADGGALMLCYGINDLGNNGTGVSTFSALSTNFIHTLRAVISFWRAARVFDDTDASISYGAGFTAGGGTSDWSVGSQTRNATALTNANFTITLPSDYTGEPIAICFDGAITNGGTVTWSGTAGITGTTSVSNINNVLFNHSKMIKRITNLTSSNAGQTIIGTVTQLDSGGSVSFDAWWLESKSPPPVIICNVARLTATGYGLYASWTGTEAAKDTEVQTLNGSILSLVAEFDSMVQVADIDNALNKTTAYFFDGLHPNEFGAARCADAVLVAIKRLRPVGTNGATACFNPPSPRQGPIVRPRRGSTYYTTEYTTQGTALTPVAQNQYWIPFVVCRGRERYIRMAVATVAAGSTQSTLRWGIYDDIGWTGYPQNLFVENTVAGAFSVPNSANALAQTPTSGTGSMNITLDPGLYWMSVKFITAGTSQTFLTVTGPIPWLMPNVSSTGTIIAGCGWSAGSMGTTALVDTAPAGMTQTANCPMIGMQIF